MATAVGRRTKVRALGSERLREALVGYGFIALPMGFFLLFFIFPIGYGLYISRYDWAIFKGPFLGWGNYRELYHDQVFWRHAVRNTLVYTAFVVPLQIALGLALAITINQAIRFRGLFRTLYYLPVVTPLVAMPVVDSVVVVVVS